MFHVALCVRDRSLVAGAVARDCAGLPLDYPQWRGPDRDGSAAAFVEPVDWPQQLNRSWSVEVGTGYGTPIMVVDVDSGETFERGTPRQLFPDTYYFSGSRNWDIAPDGRFLMITQGGSVSPELIVVQNWHQELLERVPIP